MKLSAPIFQLKRRAKRMARGNGVPLNVALDQIAREEGFPRWSLLSASMSAGPLSETILSRLEYGDLLLIAGRPATARPNWAFSFYLMPLVMAVKHCCSR